MSNVNDALIGYVNSRTQISGTEINHLIQVAKEFQENIAINENELEVPVTTDLVRKIVKIIPCYVLEKYW